MLTARRFDSGHPANRPRKAEGNFFLKQKLKIWHHKDVQGQQAVKLLPQG